MRIEDKDCTHEHAVDAKSYWVPKLKENATFWIDDVAESMKQHWRDHYLSGFWDTPIPTPQVITGLKPITLKAIVEAGALPDCLTFHDFTQAMIALRPEYMWEEIPPAVAQKAAEDLDYPAWFADRGFLKITDLEPEKPEWPAFNMDHVTFLRIDPDAMFVCYDGVPLVRITQNGVYRCQAVLSTNVGFPVALEKSPQGYFRIKLHPNDA